MVLPGGCASRLLGEAGLTLSPLRPTCTAHRYSCQVGFLPLAREMEHPVSAARMARASGEQSGGYAELVDGLMHGACGWRAPHMHAWAATRQAACSLPNAGGAITASLAAMLVLAVGMQAVFGGGVRDDALANFSVDGVRWEPAASG